MTTLLLSKVFKKSIEFSLGNNLIYDPDYIPRSIGVICDLIRDGKITEKRITESIDRVNKIKKRYNV